MGYDLVIFDNDGVLVDSEPVSNTVLAAYLTELGHPTTYEESLRDYLGAAVHRVHDLIGQRTGQRLPEEFDRVLLERTLAAMEADLEPVPGVVEVIRALAAHHLPYCVASSGRHRKIEGGHRRTGLDRYFPREHVFSAEDVGRGKPAPDLFLHAARQMGAAPERCAVVEDSPLGVQAAKAAGMDVYGYTGMTPPDRLAQATALFDDMADLPALLGVGRHEAGTAPS